MLVATGSKKRAKVSVPVFVGGLQYPWFRRNQDDTMRTVSAFFKREAHFDEGEVTVVLRKASADLFFEGYGPWPYKAALRALELKAGAISREIRYAEIKPHNGCDRQGLERGASSTDRDDESSFGTFGKCPVYAKLDDCIAHCQTQRVWAYDLIPDPKFPKSAPKRYVRATLDEFKQAYAKIAERDRHAYEVIDEKKPCFSYFDLEFSRGGGDERDGNAIARRIVDAAVSVIRRLCGSTEVEIDAIFLDSSRPNKFSQHVVLRSFVLPFGRRILAPLQGSEAAGKVARLTVDQLKDDFDKAAVDVLVYTKSRCFRIEGSSKLGSAIPLRIRSCLRYAKDSVVEVEPPKPGDLRRTLVVPELPPDHVHILRFKGDLMHRPSSLQSSTNQQENMVVPEQDKIMVQKTVENSPATIERGPLRENYSGISWLKCWNGATTTPLLDLIDVKHEFVCARQTGKKNPPQPFERLAEWAVDMARRRLRPIKPITIYAWRYVRAEFPPEQYLHLTIFGSRYCHSRGRHHRSNNVIVTVDPTTGATWQRCWDSADCCETAKTADGVTVRLYSKHFFVDERAPPEVLPRPLDLYSFEIGHGLYRRRRPEGDGDDKNEAETTREELSKKENGLIRQEAPPTSSAADLLEENVNAVAKATQAESSQVTTDVIHGALDLLANVSSRNGVHATHSPAVDNTALLNAETVTL